jgi:extracellular elastinolytic metalloproteinase
VPSPRRSGRPPLLAASLAGAAAAAALLPATAGAVGAPQAREGRGTFDVRDAAAGIAASVPAARERAARATARSLGREAVVQLDAVTGTPRVVGRTDGALTGPSRAAPSKVALDWVRDRPGLFGLDAADLAALGAPQETVTPGGVHILRWVQRYQGIPVAGAELRAHVAADGRLIDVQGAPVTDASVRSTTPALSATTALRRVRGDAGARGATPRVQRSGSGLRRETSFTDDSAASLVIRPGADGNRLAWHVRTRVDSTHVYSYLVDARSGVVLSRDNMVRWDGSGDAWTYTPSPAIASNGGDVQRRQQFGPDWLFVNDGLLGKNAWAYSDVYDDNLPGAADQVPANDGTPTDPIWAYPFQPVADPSCLPDFPCSWRWGTPGSWEDNREQNAVQAFWFVNTFAEHLRADPIGFDAVSGNFEFVDGPDGIEGDGVFVETSDGAATAAGLPDANHRNNANMYTPPDGYAPAMQMYLFGGNPGTFASNGGDDAAVVYHEYTHGLSNRLVIDPTLGGQGALTRPQAGAMGEAWSDWYAMDFLVGDGSPEEPGYQADDPDVPGEIVLAGYLSKGANWLRESALDCPVGQVTLRCPRGGFTYADYGKVWAGGPEVHADGEIWAQTLWDLRAALVERYGQLDGVRRARELITEGMRMTPVEPTFLDARDAILRYDATARGGLGRDRELIWRVFAERGMGFYAESDGPADPAPVADRSEPPAGGPATLRGTVTDADTGAPLVGATVKLPGLGAPSATTAADGSYTLTAVAGATYPRLLVADAGYDAPEAARFTVAADGSTVRDAALRRNWALSAGGTSVWAGVDPDFGAPCSAEQAIDGSLAYGWASYAPGWDGIVDDPPTVDRPQGDFPDSRTGPRVITLQLPHAVDVSSFAIDPGAICGDDDSASLGEYTVETADATQDWRTAVDGTTAENRFGRNDNHRLHTLTPAAGTTSGVRFVRITMRRPQGGTGDSGERFMDLAEFAVHGRATVVERREEPRREEPREQTREEPRQEEPRREEPRADTHGPRATLKLAAPARHGLTVLRSRAGMPLKVRFDEEARVTATVTLPAKTARALGLTKRRTGTVTLAGATVRRLAANRVGTVRLKLGALARRKLARTRSLRIVLTVVATDAAGNATRLVARPLLRR